MTPPAGIVLVTGGAGFVGRHLVQLLLAAGHRVRVLDPNAGALTLPVEAFAGSVLRPDDLEPACADVDVVFHLAAEARLGIPDADRYQRVNVQGTAAILDQAARWRVRRVVMTSTAVILRGWSDADPAPVTSTGRRPDVHAMAGPYTRAKFEAETLALDAAAAGLPVHLVYPTVPVGPGDPTPTPPTAMLRMFAHRPPPAFLDGSLNLVDVRDVALAHLRAAALAAPHGRHLVAGTDVGFADLLLRIHELTGRAMPRVRVPWTMALASAAIDEGFARMRGVVPTASIEGVRLVRHRRRHDAAADLARLGIALRPIGDAIAAAIDEAA